MSSLTIDVRKAAPEDVGELSKSLADAFYDDPVFLWWVPDDSRRLEVFRDFFQVALTHVFLGHNEVYTTPDLAAAALWAPPDKWQSSDEDMAALAPRFVEVFGDRVSATMTLLDLMEANHPQERHYYLPVIGTRTDRQGRGIGSALLTVMLARCDQQQVGSYLEATTERSRALYARHGYEITGSIRLPQGPTMWPMWRDPR